MNLWSLLPTFDVGWGCGHTDTYTINVKTHIKRKYTIEKYYWQSNTYVVSEICPYCEERAKKNMDSMPVKQP